MKLRRTKTVPFLGPPSIRRTAQRARIVEESLLNRVEALLTLTGLIASVFHCRKAQRQ